MKKFVKHFFMTCLLAVLTLISARTLYSQVNPEAGPMPATQTDLAPTTPSAEAKTLFTQAMAASDLNETRKARKLYTQAIEKDPNLGIAYLFRAGTANSTKEYIDDLNMAKAKMDNVSEWEKMYLEYQSTNLTGDREKQLMIAKSMTEKYPTARSFVELGFTYNGNKQYSEAEAAFKRAVELNPGWPGAAGALSGMYLFGEKKDLALGQEYAAKVVALAPNSPGARITLGDAYRAQNQLKKAADEYQKAIGIDPNAAASYYKLGHANLFQGKITEARANFKAAGERDDRKLFAETLQYYTYGYEGDSRKMMKLFIDAADKRSRQTGGDVNKSKSEQLESLNNAAGAAIHNNDAATLKMLVARIEPLGREMMSMAGTPEAMIFHESDMLRLEGLQLALEGNYAAARDKAEKLKSVVDPLKDSRKLEGYHYVLGFVDLKQKQFAKAVEHLKMTDQLNLYNNYLMAKAYDGLGDKTNADKYYNMIGSNNFNSLDNALLRAEVKQKLK